MATLFAIPETTSPNITKTLRWMRMVTVQIPPRACLNQEISFSKRPVNRVNSNCTFVRKQICSILHIFTKCKNNKN